MSDVEGGLELYVAATVLALLGAWSLSLAPRMWRDAAYVARIQQLGAVLGERAGGALAGVAPVGATLTFLAGVMLLVALTERDLVGSQTVLSALRYALGLAVFATVLVSFAVLLFGRPAFLVPPAARGRGLLVRQSDEGQGSGG